jgi:hypothetical protein
LAAAQIHNLKPLGPEKSNTPNKSGAIEYSIAPLLFLRFETFLFGIFHFVTVSVGIIAGQTPSSAASNLLFKLRCKRSRRKGNHTSLKPRDAR